MIGKGTLGRDIWESILVEIPVELSPVEPDHLTSNTERKLPHDGSRGTFNVSRLSLRLASL